MKKQNKAIDSLLLNSGTILENLKKDDVVKGRVEVYGFDQAGIDSMVAIRTETSDLYQDYITACGDQMKYSKLVEEKFNDCLRRFRRHVIVLKKVFFDEPDVIKELKLDTASRKSVASFVSLVTNIYNSCIKKNHIQARLAPMGLTPEKLQEELVEVAQLEALHQEHRRVIGERQRLRVDRDKKVKELKSWQERLRQCLLLVFEEDNPQYLERLGVFVRNKRSKPVQAVPPAEPTDPAVPTDPADPTVPADPEPILETEPGVGALVMAEPVGGVVSASNG